MFPTGYKNLGFETPKNEIVIAKEDDEIIQ